MELLLLTVAILSIGVTYGTDVFFALIERRALQLSSETSTADVVGRVHEVADKRMPIFEATGILAVVLLIFFTTLGLLSSWLAIITLTALLVHLTLYLSIAKPINAQLTSAAQTNIMLSNTRALQSKWDSIIGYRALLLALALLALVSAGQIG